MYVLYIYIEHRPYVSTIQTGKLRTFCAVHRTRDLIKSHDSNETLLPVVYDVSYRENIFFHFYINEKNKINLNLLYRHIG